MNSHEYAGSVTVLPYRARGPKRLGLYLNDMRRYQDLDALEDAYAHMSEQIDAARYDAALVSACQFLQAPSVLAYMSTPAAYYCHEPPRRFLQDECRPDSGPLTAYQRLRSFWHKPAESLLDDVTKRRDQRNVARARAVLTNSALTASLIRGYYARDAHVCYLGVDAERFPPRRSDGGYLLSVGAIEHHKGFEFLIESLALLSPALRPPLLIVGNHVNEGVAEHLRGLAMERSVSLEIRARVTDVELAQAYGGARAFVYAPHAEPFGLAVLEAMSAQLPVIAVGEGGVTESVIDGITGLLTPRDAPAFAAALTAVLADEQAARELGRNGREVAASWTWESAARRVEAHLSVVCGEILHTGVAS